MNKLVKRLCVSFFSLLLLGSFAVAHAKQVGQSGNSAKQYAPGQQKKTAGGAQGKSKSAKQYAPGQRKKLGNTSQSRSNSAKQYAPGQQKKNVGGL